jgi:hypothetical protein
MDVGNINSASNRIDRRHGSGSVCRCSYRPDCDCVPVLGTNVDLVCCFQFIGHIFTSSNYQGKLNRYIDHTVGGKNLLNH